MLLAPSNRVTGSLSHASVTPRCGWRPRQRGGRNGPASSPNACDSRRRRPHPSHETCTSPARPPAPNSRRRNVPEHAIGAVKELDPREVVEVAVLAGHEVARRERRAAAAGCCSSGSPRARTLCGPAGSGRRAARRCRARSERAACRSGSAASAGRERPERQALSRSGTTGGAERAARPDRQRSRAPRRAVAARPPARRAGCGQSSSPSTSVGDLRQLDGRANPVGVQAAATGAARRPDCASSRLSLGLGNWRRPLRRLPVISRRPDPGRAQHERDGGLDVAHRRRHGPAAPPLDPGLEQQRDVGVALPASLVDEIALPDGGLVPSTRRGGGRRGQPARLSAACSSWSSARARIASRARLSPCRRQGRPSTRPRWRSSRARTAGRSEASTPVRPRSSARGANGVTDSASTWR